MMEGMLDGQLVVFKWRKPTQLVEERVALFVIVLS
jgi:hypothetical protein